MKKGAYKQLNLTHLEAALPHVLHAAENLPKEIALARAADHLRKRKPLVGEYLFGGGPAFRLVHIDADDREFFRVIRVFRGSVPFVSLRVSSWIPAVAVLCASVSLWLNSHRAISP